MEKKIDITKHVLIPEHKILTEEEIQGVLKNYNISVLQLPSISPRDPVIKALEAKKGAVLQIKRKGKLGGYLYYRRVSE